MGKLIKVDGTVSDILPQNGTDYKLAELQKFVDGYIEIVRLNDSEIMVVNEEGAFTKEPNRLATIAALMYHAIRPNGIIFGDALVCKSSEVK